LHWFNIDLRFLHNSVEVAPYWVKEELLNVWVLVSWGVNYSRGNFNQIQWVEWWGQLSVDQLVHIGLAIFILLELLVINVLSEVVDGHPADSCLLVGLVKWHSCRVHCSVAIVYFTFLEVLSAPLCLLEVLVSFEKVIPTELLKHSCPEGPKEIDESNNLTVAVNLTSWSESNMEINFIIEKEWV